MISSVHAVPKLQASLFERNVLGLDLSLTATGVAVLGQSTVSSYRIDPTTKGPQRLDEIESRIVAEVSVTKPVMVALEGYSFGSKSHAHALGELGGVIRLLLYRVGVPMLVVPPNTLKKFITGNGQAEKPVLIKELYKRWGVDTNDNNQADAIGLALMARTYVKPLENMTKFELDSLAKSELVKAKPQVRQRMRA